MREQTQIFSQSLLDHARTSLELEIMLNYDPTGDNWEPGERQTLDRLKLAIKYKQKQVRQFSMILKLLIRYNIFDETTFHLFLFLFDFLPPVRGSSKRSTITSCYLVRRFTWLSKEKYDRTVHRGREARSDVPGVQYHLHDLADVSHGPVHEETFRQVHLPLLVLRVLLE